MAELNDLRIKLNQMGEKIVSRLKDRSRFKLNYIVYLPNGVPIQDRGDISFLGFALEGLEAYHASLGRYDYPDQYPVFTRNLSKSPVKRKIPEERISTVDISLRDNLLGFYTKILLPKLCENDDDPTTYGETVYIDADLLQQLHERINVGRYVAESKLATNPQIRDLVGDVPALTSLLKDPQREQIVIDRAKDVAKSYQLDPDATGMTFRWIIDQTLQVEIDYLQKKFAVEA